MQRGSDIVWSLAGLDLLNAFGEADCSYDLTPEQLCEKVQHVDALIVRSATKVSSSILVTCSTQKVLLLLMTMATQQLQFKLLKCTLKAQC